MAKMCACGCGAVLPPPHPMAHGSRKFLTKTCATRYYHHAIRNPARTRVRKEARLMRVLAEWDASPELVALVRGWLGLDTSPET